MTTEQPTVSPTGRYSISQTASILGIHRNTIHNWINGGILRSSEYNKRKANGRVFITGLGIMRLWNEKLY